MDNGPRTRRKILILVSAIDVLLSGIVLLIYFGFLPLDISGLGIPRVAVGLVGGIWFISSVAILVYQLTKTDMPE